MSVDNSKMKKVLEQLNSWCTKHYPQVQSVYDDCAGYTLQQLVYYLLGVVKENTSLTISATDQYNELYTFVNDYFNNLDVQEEINNKLDSMAKDGSLYQILRQYTDPIINPIKTDLETLENRMNQFETLTPGSTTGDAELIDIRVPFSLINGGKTFSTAGDSVRGQVSSLYYSLFNGDINPGSLDISRSNVFNPGLNIYSGSFYTGYINTDGNIVSNDSYVYTDYIYVKPQNLLQEKLYVTMKGADSPTTFTLRYVSMYDINKKFLTENTLQSVSSAGVEIPEDTYYIRLSLSNKYSPFADFMVYFGTEVLSYYKKPNYLINNNFYGVKNIGLLGDSIIKGNSNNNVGLSYLLRKFLNNVTIYDLSQGGAFMGDPNQTSSPDNGWIYQQATTLAADNPDQDLIILDGGINDLNVLNSEPNIPIGEFNMYDYNPNDTETFTGCMEHTLKTLLSSTTAKIVYIWVHNVTSREIELQVEYKNRAKEICNKWGVTFIDMFEIFNTQIENIKTLYLVDSTHPNTRGYIEYYIPVITKNM